MLTYDRPEHRNAVSRRMNAELHHAWQRFRLEDAAELGREDSHTIGACAFKEGRTPEWPKHGL